MARPANSIEVMPSGIEVAYFDSVGVDGEKQQRRYTIDGTRTVSVSTVAKYIDPDPTGLLYWSSGLTCEGIAELAGRGGDLSWLNTGGTIKAALREAELTWTDVRDKAAVRGTAVHEQILAALAAKRKLPDLSVLTEEERAYGQAVLRWWNDRAPRPILTEQMTASAEHGFAGRFDLLCEIDGERVLMDAKTRANPKDRISDHVQLAGYELANVESGYGQSDRRLILILGPEGDYIEVEAVAEESDYLAALSVYRAKSDLGKRMRKSKREAVAA